MSGRGRASPTKVPRLGSARSGREGLLAMEPTMHFGCACGVCGRSRTGDGAVVGGQSQLARATEVGQIHKAAEHVQARVHRPHAEHSPSHPDNILARRHGGRGINVLEELDEMLHAGFRLAVIAHRLLVILLNIGERVGQVVQRTLPAVEHTGRCRKLLDLLGNGLGRRAAADLFVAARHDRLPLSVTHGGRWIGVGRATQSLLQQDSGCQPTVRVLMGGCRSCAPRWAVCKSG